jgi:hypothetical protein
MDWLCSFLRHDNVDSSQPSQCNAKTTTQALANTNTNTQTMIFNKQNQKESNPCDDAIRRGDIFDITSWCEWQQKQLKK